MATSSITANFAIRDEKEAEPTIPPVACWGSERE